MLNLVPQITYNSWHNSQGSTINPGARTRKVGFYSQVIRRPARRASGQLHDCCEKDMWPTPPHIGSLNLIGFSRSGLAPCALKPAGKCDSELDSPQPRSLSI
ncbi:hypothetical protein CC2G_002230 [Coprinopsis cinerea AmutBmut pab1-1]|nr:hypothetical protein CC2G_002230 [Coprinopsis cinerea AmutBmut pab1-1]